MLEMRIGLVGLGTMGAGMVLRMTRAGHSVVGMDICQESRDEAEKNGARTVGSLAELIAALDAPRIVWLMVPPGDVTRQTILDLAGLLDAGDLVVDGGNSDFRDAPRNAEVLSRNGIGFADVGTSGGRWGWKNGYGIMVGAAPSDFARIEPILDSLATDGQYNRVGGIGSGHLVKAIHNAVQYGILQAYAEGYSILDAHPEVDSIAAVEAWQGGSSIRSFLLDQMLAALKENPALDDVGTQVSDSGMGRWTAEEAIRLGVPTPVLSTALFARFASRHDGVGNKLLVAARSHIGGQKS